MAESSSLATLAAMIALGAALFTLVVPGTLTIAVPLLIIANRSDLPVAAPWFHHLGWMPVALGGILVLRCVRDFVVVGHGTPAPVAPPTALVAAGPYRWTRNPMYVGVVGVLLGEALAMWSVPLLIHALCTWTVMHLFVLLYEEPALTRRFGDSYLTYRRLVPRWIGLPRRVPPVSAGPVSAETGPPSPPPPGRG